MFILDEAVEDYDKQYGMQDTYGCYVLFDSKISNDVVDKKDKTFEDLVNKFNQQQNEFIAGSTQGSILKTTFKIDKYLFDKHHTCWFFWWCIFKCS